MKLNKECIRDLMLYLEKNLSLSNDIVVNNLLLKNYKNDDLIYTADKLYEAGFINCRKLYTDGELFIMVNSISYQGHQFLDTIRDNKIWSQTKSKISKLASISLPIMQEVASGLIKAQLGLP